VEASTQSSTAAERTGKDDAPAKPSFESFLPALIVLALITLILFRKPRKDKAGGKTAARPPLRDTDAALRPQAMEHMEGILVELEKAGREMNARLDTKIHVLNSLMEEADKKIALLRGSNSAAPAPEEGARRAEDVRKDIREQSRDQHAQVYELHAQGTPVVEIAKKTGYRPGEIELILNLDDRNPE